MQASNFRNSDVVGEEGDGEFNGFILRVLGKLGDLAVTDKGGNVRLVAGGEYLLAKKGFIPSVGSHANGFVDF